MSFTRQRSTGLIIRPMRSGQGPRRNGAIAR
nr:MAG TPA: hypothetical protein [Caudoviricetes sp.]